MMSPTSLARYVSLIERTNPGERGVEANHKYPYLIQAVKWAGELGLSVLVDLHGAPGSQNGFDHSGLIGPVLFPSNSSNVERTLGVLKNLTEEFAKPEYGGVVMGELNSFWWFQGPAIGIASGRWNLKCWRIGAEIPIGK